MSTLVRLLPGLTPCIALALAVSGCAMEGSKSPKLLDRCVQMQKLWVRYETALGINVTGQRAQVELALYDCQRGDFDRGLKELERILRRDLIPLPPA